MAPISSQWASRGNDKSGTGDPYVPSGGSKGAPGTRPPGGQNSFIFMQFSAKKIGSHTHLGSWRPPPPEENPGSTTGTGNRY